MAYTTIDDPGLYFNTVLYTGTGSSQSITGVGFQPDFVWCKARSGTYGAYNHNLFDVARGVTKRLVSNASDAEATVPASLTAFNADGWTGGGDNETNNSSTEYVSWNWKETADAGFDIVTYTGNGSGRTLSHSLSAVPQMYIVKERGASGEAWNVYTKTLGEGNYVMLSSTNASAASSTLFNNTAPTSSVFSVGADAGTNGNTKTYVAYLFAEKQGYSKFGSYIGNANADGAFLYTGFKPAYIMVKRSDSANNWVIYDNKRANSFNEITHCLVANLYDAEQTSTSDDDCDFVSNGVKMRCTNNGSNGSGATYLYMAFAENPFVTSTAIPATAR